MPQKSFQVTKEQQIAELTSRIPPILNVDLVIVKKNKYLIGRRNKASAAQKQDWEKWLFPGGRMRYTETPQETALRILKNEAPGVKARLKKLVTAISDRGTDKRSYGVTLFYLFEYLSGTPRKNIQMSGFKWVTKDKLLRLKRAYSLNKKIVGEIDLAIRTMNTNTDEILVEVDRNNKVIGEIIKRDAHNDRNRFHRAAHIAIFNSRGEIILQKRSENLVIAPGLWDIAGGHQAAGQTINQTAQAELSEELGISCSLLLKGIYPYRSKIQSEFNYLFYGIHDGPYGFDRNEVAELKAFDCKKLLSKKYTHMKFLPHVFQYVRDLKSVWESLAKQKK